MGIDFNPTFFSHPMVKDNLTLSSPDEEVRTYWVNHGKACLKIAEYFAEETGVKYAHINTHLDHVSDASRVLQADVLNSKIDELEKNGLSVVCTGDFNAEPTSEAYSKMLVKTNDSKTIADNSYDGITFHGYGKVKEGANGPIDYAFVSKNVRVDRYKIIRNTVMDMYPSDHYPIIIDVMFEK